MSGFNAVQAQAYDAAARQRQRQQFQVGWGAWGGEGQQPALGAALLAAHCDWEECPRLQVAACPYGAWGVLTAVCHWRIMVRAGQTAEPRTEQFGWVVPS